MAHRRVGNPIIASIVSLIIAGMGVFLVRSEQGSTVLVVGALFAVIGVLGAVANLLIWKHYRDEDARRY